MIYFSLNLSIQIVFHINVMLLRKYNPSSDFNPGGMCLSRICISFLTPIYLLEVTDSLFILSSLKQHSEFFIFIYNPISVFMFLRKYNRNPAFVSAFLGCSRNNYIPYLSNVSVASTHLRLLSSYSSLNPSCQ